VHSSDTPRVGDEEGPERVTADADRALDRTADRGTMRCRPSSALSSGTTSEVPLTSGVARAQAPPPDNGP
jgi:hypothetical protein